MLGDKRLLCICNMCAKNAKLSKRLRWEKTVTCNYTDITPDVVRPFEFRMLEL